MILNPKYSSSKVDMEISSSILWVRGSSSGATIYQDGTGVGTDSLNYSGANGSMETQYIAGGFSKPFLHGIAMVM